MTEHMILERLASEIKANRRAALISLTEEEGSSPGKQGSMMAVFEDGSTLGTIGGGTLESTACKEAVSCMQEGRSKTFHYELNDTGELHMKCGGAATVFIKAFAPKDRLIIAGGGHIALELSKLGRFLDLHVVIFEDREEYGNAQRFPECEIILGDIRESLKNYPIGNDCSIVIVTRGHECDGAALRAVLGRNAGYIGMIGSRAKVHYMMQKLMDEGISKQELDRVYAPIGLKLGGGKPAEIALSILSEIMLLKNKGELRHMRDMK